MDGCGADSEPVPDKDGWCCWLLSVGWVRKGERTGKGWGSCQQTRARVDGNSPPRARRLVLQVSKHGVAGSRGLVGQVFMICKYCNTQSVNDEIFMFRLKINHA
jgi:hypothetical protein